MSPNRVVAVATPLVFAPLAGAVTAWLAEHFPGFNVDQSSLEEIFIAGALIALAPAAQWLHGWQKYEARQATRAEETQAVEDLQAAGEPGTAAMAGGAFAGGAGATESFASEPDEMLDIEELAELDELEAELLAEDEEQAGIGS